MSRAPTESQTARRPGGSRRSEQIPTVAGDIDKHGDPTVRLRPRRRHEGNAGVTHPLVGGIEVLHPEEETNAPGHLRADDRRLIVTVGSGEQDPRLRVGRSYHHPPLRLPTGCRRRRRVLDQLEAERVHEKGDGGVIVIDDDGGQLQMRHALKPAAADGSPPRGRQRRGRVEPPVWDTWGVTLHDPGRTRGRLLRRGRRLEVVTLGWNVVGIVVLALAAIGARSVALAGFGLDSLIEIGASTVVLWELANTAEDRQRRALRLIGAAFVALAVYLAVQSTVVLVAGYHPRHSLLGIVWTAVTAALMFALAAGKARTGAALDNPVLRTEGRVTAIDGILATAVLIGLVLNAALGWWWADPAAGYVLVYYGAREARAAFAH